MEMELTIVILKFPKLLIPYSFIDHFLCLILQKNVLKLFLVMDMTVKSC
jgi:hypothetical protein